jgi:putative transposase
MRLNTFLQGRVRCRRYHDLVMPAGLHRTYGAHYLPFITNSCYPRLPLLASARAPDGLLSVLEQTRRKYRFVVVGYVVLPEHIHLLITEPEVGSPSTVMQVLKQRTAKALLPTRKHRDRRQRELFVEDPGRSFWHARFYDFNVWSERKRFEKLRYMHRNPVKRGLVDSPEQWRWSSYRHYFFGEAGPVQVNVGWGEISFRGRVAHISCLRRSWYRPSQTARRAGHPFFATAPAFALPFRVLLGAVDELLQLFFLRIIRIFLQQFLPRLHGAFWIHLALPAHDA